MPAKLPSLKGFTVAGDTIIVAAGTPIGVTEQQTR